MRPGSHRQMALPDPVTEHRAPGPHGEGSQGSGLTTQRWSWQMYPLWQSGSLTHSGLQPEMVSGLGMRPGSHLQMALPEPVTEQTAPGPQGDGKQGSGFSTHLWSLQTSPLWQSGSLTHSGPQPVMVSGLGMRPGWQVQMALPCGFGWQRAPGPQGFGKQGSWGGGGPPRERWSGPPASLLWMITCP